MNIQSVSLSVIMPVFNERYFVEESLNRLLRLQSPYIASLQIIVVDDQSTDGTFEIVKQAFQERPEVRLVRHETNQGKGAAIRTGLEHASGDVTIVHDADLEYNPDDIPALMRVFVEEGADAVFGSRYLSAPYRRVLLYKHSLINKTITAAINWLTDLDLSDVETCYKALKTDLFKSIPLRSNDFRFEIEITMKLARRSTHIFEVPIRYLPRSHSEGKKIRARDGFLAMLAALRFFFIEDLYHRDKHGLRILTDMNNAPQFNRWMADAIRPFIGDRVLEIGSGLASLTRHFIPRKLFLASDIEPQALRFLKSFAIGRPYFRVEKIDAESAEDFKNLKGQFDTVLMINVLEHVGDEARTLKNVHDALTPGGRAVILVPQFPAFFGSFDKALSHRERYTKEKFRARLEQAGFDVEKLFDFNRATLPSWYLNGKILKRERFSLIQLKILEMLMPLIRRADRFLPWGGLSLIGVAKKKPA